MCIEEVAEGLFSGEGRAAVGAEEEQAGGIGNGGGRNLIGIGWEEGKGGCNCG